MLLAVVVTAAVGSGPRASAEDDDPQGTIVAMQATIDAQATTIADLQAQVAKLKPKKTKTPKLDKRCESVSQEVQDALIVGVDASGVHLTTFEAVKSKDFDTVYFVAANLEGEGMDDGQIVVFATNDIEHVATMMSVNSMAQEFFVWPDADSTDAHITMDDDGADESVDCVNQALGH